MGSMLFTPLASRAYNMRLSDGRSFPLPDIFPQGVVMQLTEQDAEFLEFTVSQSENLPDQTIFLVGQMRGMICCVAQGRLKTILKIKMPLAEFPSQGIASFTLYDVRMNPIVERLVYIHPSKKLYITAESDQKNYEIRGKATVKIKITDENGQPVSAHLGVSVFDKEYINPADPVNILSYCHLSSQIRGKIYDPAYYFDEKNPDRLVLLDLLMLTQGWRRYVWNEENLQPLGQVVITDEITGIQTIKNRRIQNTEQLIQVSGSNGDSELIWADEDGHFTIHPDLLKTLRGGYVYLKPMLTKEYGPEIKFDDPFFFINKFRQMKKTFYPYLDLSRITREEILRLPYMSPDSVFMISEVVIFGKS